MKRFVAFLLSLTGLSVLSLAILVYALLATEVGLRWSWREIARYLPELTIKQSEGTWLNGFTVKGLIYKDQSITVQIDVLRSRIRWPNLWWRVLEIEDIDSEGIRIVSLSEENTEPITWPQWPFPFKTILHHFHAQNISYESKIEPSSTYIEQLDLALHVDAVGLRLIRCTLLLPQKKLDVSGHMAWSGTRQADLHTHLTLTIPDSPYIEADGTVVGDLQRLIVRQKILLHKKPFEPIPLTVRAVIQNPLEAFTWTAQVEVPTVTPYRVKASVQAQGNSREVRCAGNFLASLDIVGETRGQLQLRYAIPEHHVSIEDLTLVFPRTDTELHLTGKLSELNTTPVYTLSADWKNAVWPPDTKAEWYSAKGNADIRGGLEEVHFQLHGLLAQVEVQAGGHISWEKHKTVFHDVQVRGAGAEATLKGTLGQELDFTWKIQSPDIGKWLPDAKGTLHSQGTLTGSLETPAISAELTSNQFHYKDYNAQIVSLRLKTGIQATSPFDIALWVTGLQLGERTIQAELQGQGTRTQHTLAAKIHTSDTLALTFLAEGGLHGSVWGGRIIQSHFYSPSLGEWQLKQPSSLSLSSKINEWGTACWKNDITDICFQGHYDTSGTWRASLEVNDFSPSRFTLSQEKYVTGHVNGKVHVSGSGSYVSQGHLELNSTDVMFQYRSQKEKMAQFKPTSTLLTGTITEHGTRFRLAAEEPGFSSLEGDLGIIGPLDISHLKKSHVLGSVRLDVPDIAFLRPFLPDVEHIQGRFHSELQIDGTLNTPIVRFNAALKQAGASIPKLGIILKEVELEAVSHNHQEVTLTGHATSAEGSVQLEGKAILSETAGWPISLSCKGNNFLMADIPEAEVFISPDFTFTATNGKLALKGKIEIPKALIHVPDQASAVSPSEDVIVISNKTEVNRSPSGPSTPTIPAMETQLNVILGHAIEVQGSGFKGRLEGNVWVQQVPNGPVVGNGQIIIREGQYTFYGVELALEEGRLLFTDSPIDNPNLDLSVTRKSSDTLAGLKVLGTIRKPNVSLYSDRPIPQADILAYLVTGHPLSLASQQEGSALHGAATSLGGTAGNFLAKEISGRLGLSGLVDISVQNSIHDQGISGIHPSLGSDKNTAGTPNTAVFLGKYLTPRLYVQYGMGLFQNTYVFRIRYELSEHWKIQTETGEYSGGDIFYQWEK